MSTKTLAFEIGTEELPAFDLHQATAKLSSLAEKEFNAANIPYGVISVYSSPRRLILIVEDVPSETEAATEEYRGPSVAIAFDAEGNPTKAALGFAKGKGVDVSQLEKRDEGGTEYVYAVKHTSAKDIAGLLPTLLGNIIESIPWPKVQRWGDRREQFSRPVRWLLALLGDAIIPVTYAGLTAGNITCGHRFLAPGPHSVSSAENLIETLSHAYVVPSEELREQSIRAQVSTIEQQTGLTAELPAKTLEEVVNLTEYPTVMVGSFDELFLAVPKEITVDAMLVHQRYFPLFTSDGSLSNQFLITSNGDPAYADNIVDGNNRVVAARLYDAKFFYDEDLKQPLESYVSKLQNVVFQESLGTTYAKTHRIVELAKHLSADAHLDTAETSDAARAAYLCKADLVTSAVVEFTSVQGIMGSYYAQAAGETDQVAQAIADHYRPRFSGDNPPASIVGKIVAMADKLDTICGLFAVGQAPTGSSDPFALRRNALGIITMLIGTKESAALPVSLGSAIDVALSLYQADHIQFDSVEVRKEVVDFFVTRTKVMLRDSGCAADSIDAVLAVGTDEPIDFVKRVRALETARNSDKETFDDLATAYARANNLRDESVGTHVSVELLTQPGVQLADAIAHAEEQIPAALQADDYAGALSLLASLRKPIDAFFEGVMVMDDDPTVRDNNLKLLNAFIAVFARVADFGKMAKS